MDYGPFGFMDEVRTDCICHVNPCISCLSLTQVYMGLQYHPLFAKWTGSGEHFGFLNQPDAGFANFAMLVSSIMPIVEAYSSSMEEAQKYQDEIMERGQEVFDEKLSEALRSKLGFHPSDESADELWSELEVLLRENKTDWTVFWRQLTAVVKEFPVHGDKPASTSYGDMFDVLYANDEVKEGSCPFYGPLDDEARRKMMDWIQSWREMLVESYKEIGPSMKLSEDGGNFIAPEERMRMSNPKYVLREWMLVEAYSKASPSSIQSRTFPVSIKSEQGDESMIHELFELIKNPYDEGTDEQDEKYYKRAHDDALTAGGTAFMS